MKQILENIDTINRNEVVDYKDIFEDAFANDEHNYAKVTVPTAIIIILRVETCMTQLEFRYYSVTFFTFNHHLNTNLVFA